MIDQFIRFVTKDGGRGLRRRSELVFRRSALAYVRTGTVRTCSGSLTKVI
jgi:hypothetical protein